MYKVGPEKGPVLEAAVRQLRRPARCLELGSFIGYGSVRVARALPPGGRLFTVEANPQCAEVAQQVSKAPCIVHR